MKRIIRRTVLTAVILILSGCGRGAQPEEEIDGGVKNNTNYDAPKSIESTEITSFYCEFSTLALLEEDTFLGNRVYQLSACLEDGIAKGNYKMYGQDVWREESFVVESSFMEALQEIVQKYDFVENNGRSYDVSGLPDKYGAILKVEYQSGESIYASDNQENFLSIAAMEELESLFREMLKVTEAENENQEIKNEKK